MGRPLPAVFLAGLNPLTWIRDYWPPARRAYASESSLQGVAYRIDVTIRYRICSCERLAE